MARVIRTLTVAALVVAGCGTGPARDASPSSAPSDAAPSAAAAPSSGPPTPFPKPADFSPDVIALGPDGSLYASSCQAARVYRLIASNDLEVVIGSGGSGFQTGFAGDGGPATEAQVSCPVGIVFDAAGRLVLADHGNNRIRRVDEDGIIQTIAGKGPSGTNRGLYGGDGGPATEAYLQEPTQLAYDAAGDLYISDRDNDRVRKVDAKGIITSIAGDGTDGFGGDGGPSIDSIVDDPAGLAIAPDGTVYVADSNNKRIRRIDPSGIITTIAGFQTEAGTSGDGGAATEATFEDPEGLAIDAAGNLYIADTPANRIRMIDPDGIITTFAGTGIAGASGDGGPATEATLDGPSTLVIDAGGNVYICDQNNGRVRKVTPDGIISTIFGG